MKQNNMKFISPYITRFLGKIPYKQIFFLWLIFATGYALAQGTPAAEPQSDSDVIRAIVQILNLVFTLITFLLTPAIILAGWLLSPDWTMGDFFGLRPYFINVWVLVSNLVYIVFALMLLWMAVMQIFSGESNYAFKKKLPRFLVGIMIVPFTWLIVSWTLSFANQAVAAVLSIPAGAIGGVSGDVGASGDKGLFHKKTIPRKFVLDFWEDSPGAGSETTDCKGDGGDKCISPAEFIAYNEAGPFFIIMVYAYDIFKIQNTEQVNFESVCAGGADVKQCVKSIWQLLRKFWVALITTIFFAIILIALCWVLLARAFKLWIYVMFSPLFGLSYALSDEWLWKTLESEWWGEWASLGKVGFVPFFQLAMVPVLVSAVLSFWLLFIGVMNNTFTTGAMAPTGSGGFCTKSDFMVKYCIEWSGESYSSRLIIGNGGGPSGDYTITFEFGSMISDMVGNSAGKTVVGAAGGLAEVGTDIFAHIILSIIAIAVMWMGVKAAVSYDEVTRKAFAPFAKFGDSVGNFVQNIPSYLPTPHPAFAAFNPATYRGIGTAMDKNLDSTIANNNKSMADQISWSARAAERSSEETINSQKTFRSFLKDIKPLTSEQDKFKQAQTTTLSLLDQSESSVPEADKAEFGKFREALKNATQGSDLEEALKDHTNAIQKLETGKWGSKFSGGDFKELGWMFGAHVSTTWSTKSFQDYRIRNGVIRTPWDTKDFWDTEITPEHRAEIRNQFPSSYSPTGQGIEAKKAKLTNLWIQESDFRNLDEAQIDKIIQDLIQYRSPE
jgi:hypothetical protein